MNEGYIVAVICKNEQEYIKDFVEYHLNLGFDKIIVADNNDEGNTSIEDALKELIDSNKVELVNLRGKNFQQRYFYDNICNNRTYEWCACIDCDEYLTFNKDCGITNIKDFFKGKENWDICKVNWMVYGDNELIHKGEGTVDERFKEPKPMDFKYNYSFPENRHIKSIIHKTIKGKVNFVPTTPHSPKDRLFKSYSPNGEKAPTGPFVPKIDHSILYIRHFFTKSIEEWVKYKMHRGYADWNAKKENTYKLSAFFKYNNKTPEKLEYLKSIGIKYE